MKPMINCSDDTLRLLLQEDEQSDEYRDAALHVDSCPHCQQRIGELAAENEEWHEAHEMLLAGDESVTATIDRQSADARSSVRRQPPTAWTEAMARQLLSPPSHPEMLGRIGRYEVERLIGTGGMGVVFKAFDTELNRPVAVKLLTPYLAGSGAARKRFSREARAAAAVVHEHVVSIYNVETEGEVPASHPTANIFPRVYEWDWREGSPKLKKFAEVPQAQTKNAEIDLAPQPAGEVAKSATGLAKSMPQTALAMPARVHYFNSAPSVKITCSADGKLIAIAHGGQASPAVEGWKRSVEILEAETGKSVVVISPTTKDEEAVLDATEGIPFLEDGSLAFSPDGTTSRM